MLPIPVRWPNLEVTKDPADADAKSRRLKVQVLRASATVRARDIFDVRTYEDRDWAARLATAIDGPVIATDIGLRVTSYLSADPEDSSRLRVLVSGEAVRAQPAPRRAQFVFASTALVYGRTELIPFVETDSADHPLSPYAASKRAAEMLGFTYHHLHGLDFSAVRFFSVYGPRCRPEMLAYKWLDSAFGGAALPYHNNGQMHRDWTFIDDIVTGLVAASDRRMGYQVINLGRGEPVLLADFVETLEYIAGRKARLEPVPMPNSDVHFTYAGIGKAQQLLNYHPRISFEEGIQRFHSWYMEHVRPQH